MCRLKLPILALITMTEAALNLPSDWRFCSANGTDGLTVAQHRTSEETRRKWPFIVRLSLGRWGYLCSGTLLDGTTVITAAHCCDGYLADEIKVHINDYINNKINANIRVHSVHSHPAFNRDTYQNDICVLRLKLEVTDLLSEIERSSHDNHYPCLPQEIGKLKPDSHCYTIGWGYYVNNNGKKHSTRIQSQAIKVMNNKRCREVLPKTNPKFPQFHSDHEMICAVTEKIDFDNACEGDSGGPLLCEENGKAVLAGITSFGPQCSSKQNPAEFTRVASYVDFIEANRTTVDVSPSYADPNFARASEDPDQVQKTFQRIAERRAEKSKIRRYCTRPSGSNEHTMVNLALQQKRVDAQLEALTACYIEIRDRRLEKLPPLTPPAILDRELLKLDTFGKKQVCRRAQFKGHQAGLPCWAECEQVMVNTQHRARKSIFSKSEKDIIAYWIKECSKKVIRPQKTLPRTARIMAKRLPIY